MAEETPPAKSRAKKLDDVMALAFTALLVAQYLDVMTHGRIRVYVRGIAARARVALNPVQRVPSPAEVSAMHAEAVTITREAAPDA